MYIHRYEVGNVFFTCILETYTKNARMAENEQGADEGPPNFPLAQSCGK